MAMRFVRDEPGEWVMATQRLCLTEDRTRLVPDTDPAARWLWCTPGQKVRRADAERYGLLGEDEGERSPESKARRAPANKSRTPGGDK